MDTKDLSKVQKDRNVKLEKLRSEGFDYPNDFEKKYAAPYGSIYGKVSHGFLGTIIRPSNKDKKIKGLYYVGGGVHPGGGTPIVIMSSGIVTQEIAKDYV